MSSSNNVPARPSGPQRLVSIQWGAIFQKFFRWGKGLFNSLRHRAGQTEYTPPAWLQRFRFSWFRLGLIGIALFVFTQKQIDFTVSVGKEGLAVGESQGRHSAVTDAGATQTMTVLPASVGGAAPATTHPAAKASASTDNWSVDQLDAAAVRAYVNRFEKVAQGEEAKFSIPAPANMALAILNSQAGKSSAARRDNNHFGTITAGDYYDNAWMNWRAHSELIDRRFPQLADNSVNYQQWVAALAKTNYSSDPKLVNKLMDIVERFNLERL